MTDEKQKGSLAHLPKKRVVRLEPISQMWGGRGITAKVRFADLVKLAEPIFEVEFEIDPPLKPGVAKRRSYRYIARGMDHDLETGICSVELYGPIDTDTEFGNPCPACGMPITEAFQPTQVVLTGWGMEAGRVPVGLVQLSCGRASHRFPPELR